MAQPPESVALGFRAIAVENMANAIKTISVQRGYDVTVVCLSYGERGEKTSIICATPHESGRLHAVLKLFADAGINLTRIASMPLRSDPDNYSFFLDFEGDENDATVKPVLEKMARMTISLKRLGSYPANGSK